MGSWSHFFPKLTFFWIANYNVIPLRHQDQQDMRKSHYRQLCLLLPFVNNLLPCSFICLFSVRFFFWFRLRIFSILLFCRQYPNLLSIPVLIDIFCVEYWNEINGDSSVALDDLDFQCVCGGGVPLHLQFTPH